MSPQLCARIAELPNIVAIKYSVPREMYVELTHLAGDRLIVSTASEEEWVDKSSSRLAALFVLQPAVPAASGAGPADEGLHRPGVPR